VRKANTLQRIHASVFALIQLLVGEACLRLAHRAVGLLGKLDLLEDVGVASVHIWNAELIENTNAVFQQ